jgi:hypothetical protein
VTFWNICPYAKAGGSISMSLRGFMCFMMRWTPGPELAVLFWLGTTGPRFTDSDLFHEHPDRRSSEEEYVDNVYRADLRFLVTRQQ